MGTSVRPQYDELGEAAAERPSNAASTAGSVPRRAALRACSLALGLSALVAVHASLCVLLPLRPTRYGRHALAAEREARGDEDELLVLAISDWGGINLYPYVTPAQLAVRDAMVATARGSAARKRLVMALGDNFYFTGVTSASDPRFQRTFEDVYVTGYPELSETDMWRLVAGNRTHARAPRRTSDMRAQAHAVTHLEVDEDGGARPARAVLALAPVAHRSPSRPLAARADDYYGSGEISAQLEYTNRSAAWHFPSPYYAFTETLGGGKATAHFVMIDTVILSAGEDGILMGEEARARSEAHWAWLRAQLEGSAADFLIVGGHYPVWSAGEHGPTAQLVERLRPLLIANNVSAYLAGHDHCAEAFVDEGVHHHGVGGAHLLNFGAQNARALPDGILAMYLASEVWPANYFKGTFAALSLGTRALRVTHYDSDGNALITLEQPPREQRHRRATEPLPATTVQRDSRRSMSVSSPIVVDGYNVRGHSGDANSILP